MNDESVNRLCPPSIDPRVGWALATRGLRELARGWGADRRRLRLAADDLLLRSTTPPGFLVTAFRAAQYGHSIRSLQVHLADAIIAAGPAHQGGRSDG